MEPNAERSEANEKEAGIDKDGLICVFNFLCVIKQTLFDYLSHLP